MQETLVEKSCSKFSNHWQKIEELWKFRHVIGTLNGKHISILAPRKSGSLHHNYNVFIVYCYSPNVMLQSIN